jgi:hypothetical protein
MHFTSGDFGIIYEVTLREILAVTARLGVQKVGT